MEWREGMGKGHAMHHLYESINPRGPSIGYLKVVQETLIGSRSAWACTLMARCGKRISRAGSERVVLNLFQTV
jgi:hypothetical protein